jgi:hypothetical protein
MYYANILFEAKKEKKKNLAPVVRLLTYIGEVSGSNLGWDTEYVNWRSYKRVQKYAGPPSTSTISDDQ